MDENGRKTRAGRRRGGGPAARADVASGWYSARRFAMIGLVAALLAGYAMPACTGVGARVRRHTYPPGFAYVSREQLRSAMWQLAADVHRLDALLRQPPPVDPGRRAEVVRILFAMDAAARRLRAEGWESNHPLVDAHLGDLRDDIARAKDAVMREPPSYYLAGSVSGACLYCHP